MSKILTIVDMTSKQGRAMHDRPRGCLDDEMREARFIATPSASADTFRRSGEAFSESPMPMRSQWKALRHHSLAISWASADRNAERAIASLLKSRSAPRMAEGNPPLLDRIL